MIDPERRAKADKLARKRLRESNATWVVGGVPMGKFRKKSHILAGTHATPVKRAFRRSARRKRKVADDPMNGNVDRKMNQSYDINDFKGPNKK